MRYLDFTKRYIEKMGERTSSERTIHLDRQDGLAAVHREQLPHVVAGGEGDVVGMIIERGSCWAAGEARSASLALQKSRNDYSDDIGKTYTPLITICVLQQRRLRSHLDDIAVPLDTDHEHGLRDRGLHDREAVLPP